MLLSIYDLLFCFRSSSLLHRFINPQWLAGSYDIDDYVGNPAYARNPGGMIGDHSRYWVSPDVPGAIHIPMFLESTWLGSVPRHNNTWPTLENGTENSAPPAVGTSLEVQCLTSGPNG